VERAIVDEAVAQVEAEPDEIRAAKIILASGDGWHEGVVGIVASRLAERFERPAIVLTRQGDRAKGSGRSLPGVDLHAIVAAADETLTRWGGHPGAVGLELPAALVARFRDDLIRAAEGSGAAIARARVRRVDAVVGGRDLGLAAAEAMEALAPFGRGNPSVRLVVPGVELASPVRVGEGRHLQVRLRSDGVHARGIGFRMGERAAGLDLDERHDAVVALEIERWQGLVSPRVSLEAIETLTPRPPLDGQCAQACDVRCPDRLGARDLRALIDAPEEEPLAAAPPAGPPLGVRDRRGQGAALSTLAALAGADRGVVAVVADVARRREALAAALEPGRLGAEVAVLGGARCDPGAMATRLALARGVPALAMLDYGRLAEVDLPEGMHLALVDPPATPEQAAWAANRAEGRWLHMVWGDAEIAEALRVAEGDWELRPAVTAIWLGLRDGGPRAHGPELEAVLLGEGPVSRHPRVAARALAVLAELGLVEVGAHGVRAAADPQRRELEASDRYRDARRRLDEARAFLTLAPTLDLFESVEPPLAAATG
jgi:single-stranded-DNA-specific exonuclease